MGTKQLIVDVRTTEEWEMDGHAEGTVNYPLGEFASYIDEIKKHESIVLVCRSGGRAEVAKGMLLQAGIKNVINKGAWQNVL